MTKRKSIKSKKVSRKGPKKPQTAQSKKKKQDALLKLTGDSLTTPHESICAIFLVRQGLNTRREQFIAIANDRKQAIYFCRHYRCYAYTVENDKKSLGLEGIRLSYNSTNGLLLIKGEDFNRQEAGRTNSSPLWYLNIANVTIVKDVNKVLAQLSRDQ